MTQQTLFIMVGYPGSGKTTASHIIQVQTGAVHLWADHERKQRLEHPTYSHAENLKLYAELNQVAEKLLAEGKSVIYDTNFNFYKDRELMRSIAKKYDAQAIVVWVHAPIELARERATKGADKQHTRVLGDMPLDHFERIAQGLEEPHADERKIEFDGTGITPEVVAKALKQL